MKVLYAEDERQLSVAVVEILKMEGFEVTPVYDGQEALDALKNDYFDAVILDVMMPRVDGIEVLRQMRQEGNFTAVLMLTAKASLDDRVEGLTVGADDYLAKPFAMKELIVRLKSLLRRNIDYRHTVIKYANIELDTNTCELRSDKGSLRLSNPEADVLSFLIRNIGTYYTADEINTQVWNKKESSEKAELYVYYLRNKLIQIRAKVKVLIRDNTYALGE